MTPTDLPGGAILTCQSWVHRAGAIEVLHGDSRDPAEKAQDGIRAHGPHQTGFPSNQAGPGWKERILHQALCPPPCCRLFCRSLETPPASPNHSQPLFVAGLLFFSPSILPTVTA